MERKHETIELISDFLEKKFSDKEDLASFINSLAVALEKRFDENGVRESFGNNGCCATPYGSFGSFNPAEHHNCFNGFPGWHQYINSLYGAMGYKQSDNRDYFGNYPSSGSYVAPFPFPDRNPSAWRDVLNIDEKYNTQLKVDMMVNMLQESFMNETELTQKMFALIALMDESMNNARLNGADIKEYMTIREDLKNRLAYAVHSKIYNKEITFTKQQYDDLEKKPLVLLFNTTSLNSKWSYFGLNYFILKPESEELTKARCINSLMPIITRIKTYNINSVLCQINDGALLDNVPCNVLSITSLNLPENFIRQHKASLMDFVPDDTKDVAFTLEYKGEKKMLLV